MSKSLCRHTELKTCPEGVHLSAMDRHSLGLELYLNVPSGPNLEN